MFAASTILYKMIVCLSESRGGSSFGESIFSYCGQRYWGKQRINYQAIKDWNDLDSDTRNAPTLVSFKRNLFSKLLT